jgi:hypothetical protein
MPGVRGRLLLHLLIRNIYEHALVAAVWPMMVAAGMSLGIIFIGSLRADALVIEIGFWIGAAVAAWAIGALLYSVAFNRRL